ncbi:MAG: cytochrome b [Chloroflexi bacterium]|nr:cytochrome b [Chloroflexota bacterium]
MTQNSPKRYHPLQVTLHWLTVVLVFAAFIFGKYSSFLPNDANEIAPLRIHMLLGITLLLVIIVRFITRMKIPRPTYASTGNAFLDGLGKFVHYALYLLVFLMTLSGMSLSIQAGLPSIVFGGSGILPANFYDFAARMLHGFISPALFLLVLLHVGAAFYHQFALKDNLLTRMGYGK